MQKVKERNRREGKGVGREERTGNQMNEVVLGKGERGKGGDVSRKISQCEGMVWDAPVESYGTNVHGTQAD